MEKANIYPNVFVKTTQYSNNVDNDINMIVTMETKLRQFHLGKWYFVPFFRKYYIEDPIKAPQIIQGFHAEVYMFQHFGEINPDLITMPMTEQERLAFELCEDQRDEKDRLKEEFEFMFYKKDKE